MKGIELTRAGTPGKGDPVWLPLNSIVLVWPYNGFDDRIDGSEIALINNGAVHVVESYATIVERLNGYDTRGEGPKSKDYVDDDETYA